MAAPVDSDSPRRSSGTKAGPLRGDAGAVAQLLRQGMVEVRAVRYSRYSANAPITDVLRTFDGAADAILAAGACRWAGSRSAAFRKVAETWIRRAGPELLHSFALALQGTGAVYLLDVIQEAEKELEARPGKSDAAVRRASASAPETAAGLTRAELRLFRYAAQRQLHDRVRCASVHIVVAMPQRDGTGREAPWRLRVIEFEAPDGCRVRTEAFRRDSDAPSEVEVEAGRRFVMGDGALTITRNNTADMA